MKYFTKNELLDMKIAVIKSHMKQRKFPANTNLQAASNIESIPLNLSPALNELPDELLLKIFSYLSFSDIFKLAKVSKRWHNLIYDKSNWKILNFMEWKSKSCLSMENYLNPLYIFNEFSDSAYEMNYDENLLSYKDTEYSEKIDEDYLGDSDVVNKLVNLKIDSHEKQFLFKGNRRN